MHSNYRLRTSAGALGFFLIIAPLQEMDAARADNTSGMAVAALAVLVGLVWLARRVNRRMAGEAECLPRDDAPIEELPVGGDG